ncbi:S41 family peptidase [Allomuricauda sp. d1]|uniref:S41 family peptidase n=1 Tax=Allomuricauda sp. d1 TaxID=3136725 RepID=UPI0031D05F2A
MKKYILLFLAASFMLSCSNDDDGIQNPNTNPPIIADFPTQDFMWKAMNLWYFWQAEVPDLADTKDDDAEAYAAFLAATPDPDDFYNSIQFSEDRFSFANEDYTALVNNLVGISKSNGLEFGLVRFADSNDLFGYVRYIIAGSDADTKDIERGDLFTEIDGQTLNLDNYIELLFGDNDTYTLGLATIENNTVTPTGEEVTLTKMEGLEENPILVAKTLDVDGIKVAYLMYNGFNRNFNVELNDAFAQFVADGCTELVLDMRYNPGGSVNTSRLLASMVYGTNTNDLYIRQRWNDKIQSQFSAAQLEDYFATEVSSGVPLNSLNLDKVYVLATNSSASASELVMNGLAPYIDVIHIGETTRGKNEFSITMVDDPENSFIYDAARENQINPNNSWAIQPLVGRNENADGFFDYTNGLAPDIELQEDLANLGVLGEEDEPLLARALQEIGAASAKFSFEVQMPAKMFTSSKMFTPIKDNMYLDNPPVGFK